MIGQTSAFDPLQGKAHEVLTLDIHPGALYNWMPSPDGSLIVFMDYNPLEGRIRLLSLKGELERDIVVKGWAGFNSVDWSADSKSLFVSSQSPTSSTLRCAWTSKATPRLFGTNAGRGEPGRLLRRTAAN